MSSNGKHLLNLINNYELVTMNSYEVCQGIFTRVNNKNCSERSVLDYIFVTTDLCSSISSMIIDEKKLYTPRRNLKKAKKYTDHNAIIFRLNIPTSIKREEKPTNILCGTLMICMDGINLGRLLKMTNN